MGSNTTDTEYQRKKELLNSYQDLQRQVVGLSHELTKWGALGTKIAQSYEQGFGASGDSKPELGGTGLADIRFKIERELRKAIKCRDEVENLVKKAQKKRYRDLLTLHFINGMSVKDIADFYEKESCTIRKVLSNAIKELDI